MTRISERDERAREASEQRILRMSPEGKGASSIDALLRGRLEDIAQAIRDKNIDHLMTFYAANVVVFDVLPPLNVSGADAYRKNFERWFASFEGPLNFELIDLHIAAGDVAAFCHYLSLVSGTRPGGDRKSGYWVRGTTCFERRDGQWLVTHEHISMPAAM